jgi:hypothetical protein
MYSLYKNEYRIFKLVETTIRKGLRQKKENKEDEPNWASCIVNHVYTYTWKHQKETPCVAELNEQKMSFFSSFFLIQNWRMGGQNRSWLGELVLVGGGRR